MWSTQHTQIINSPKTNNLKVLIITLATQDQKKHNSLTHSNSASPGKKNATFHPRSFLQTVIDIGGVNIMSMWPMFALWNTQEGEGLVNCPVTFKEITHIKPQIPLLISADSFVFAT
jgi:hypothetical protein